MRTRRGFTLIELMVVIAIMALMASIVAINVGGSDTRARQKIVLADMTTIKQACEMFRLDMGRYPEGLTELWQRPANSARWGPKPYVDPYPPLDPWGHEYVYTRENGEVELTCYGADGQPGGVEESSDLRYSELRSRR